MPQCFGETPVITTWLYRGQSIQEASQLTGRTKVWSAIAELQRPRIEELFSLVHQEIRESG